MSKPHPKLEIGRGGLGCKADISSHFGRSSLDDGITAIELGKSKPTPETIAQLQGALESAGVEFTNGKRPGVRLKG